jgi:transposase
MGRSLKMSQIQTIRSLHDEGWSNRKIARELGVNRKTIEKVLKQMDSCESTISPIPSNKPTKSNQSNQSKCQPYQKLIEEKMALGLTAKRIWQDLKQEVQFSAGYDSVKIFVRSLSNNQPEVYARMETSPGHEAQVDFGEGAFTRIGSTDKYKRPFLFVMTLSCSRHAYQEVVWRQDVESFIRCHENAFKFFGGVVHVVRLDNLKAGVLAATLFGPELNHVYESYAYHAGFIPVPCLPRTPEHKGKVESGVKYTQNNALMGKRFESLDEQNAYLRHWNLTIAFSRKHGTTKRIVSKSFDEEMPHLKPLPDESFIFFRIAKCRVHSDAFVEVDSSYYMAPDYLVGHNVDVHWNANKVEIYHNNKLLVTHPKVLPGVFQKAPGLVPRSKTMTEEEYLRNLLELCKEIGPECQAWAEKVWHDRRQLGLRTIAGIQYLKKTHSNHAINDACSKALAIGSIHYHAVELLCKVESTQKKELIEQHELIRDPSYYQAIINQGEPT